MSRPALVGIAGVATAGFGVFGTVTGAGQTATYVVTVVVLGVLLVRLDRTVRFSDLVTVGVTVWAVAHLAGGLIGLDGDRVLYNAVLAPHLRYDNVVHFFGFGVAGIAAWEALAPQLVSSRGEPMAAGITVWLFGMGIGALNEVVEFAIALNVEESNVGGYLNTGRDLVANMLGAAVAGVVVARRVRLSAVLADRRPLRHRRRAERASGLAEDRLTPALSWSYQSLDRRWHEVRGDVAPWWREVSMHAFRSGIADAATALKNWSTPGRGSAKAPKSGSQPSRRRIGASHRSASWRSTTSCRGFTRIATTSGSCCPSTLRTGPCVGGGSS